LIDLHCHILPGVDDGALDMRDSVGMARQAVNDGIEAICATPHIRHDHDVRIHELAARVAELNKSLEAEGIPVAVLRGGVVAETIVEDLSDEELALVALGRGNWVLLEPSPGPLDDVLLERIGKLRGRGYRALVAHPERHLSADVHERIAGLIAAGAMVQATADFFLREEMADGMKGLAEAGLVHVLSSDAHSSHGGRPVHMSEAFECLDSVEPVASHIEWMREEAPRAIIEGDEPDPPFGPRI
jgi:protein-tyrosine phosphatase